MKILPIEQDAVQLVHTILDKSILRQMEELSVSEI